MLDIHLCEVRELQIDPLITKLIDTYDADCAAASDRNCNVETSFG